MILLPDDALVVHGGINTVELLKTGSGVTVDAFGNLHGLSVQSAPGKTASELSVGIPNRKMGITTVGAVRAAGGEVTPDPTINNPYHCQLEGISADTAYTLLNPPVLNPSWVK